MFLQVTAGEIPVFGRPWSVVSG